MSRVSSRFDDADDAVLDPHLEGGGTTMYDDETCETCETCETRETREWIAWNKSMQDEEDAMAEWELRDMLRRDFLRRECESRRGATLIQVPDEDGEMHVAVRYVPFDEDEES